MKSWIAGVRGDIIRVGRQTGKTMLTTEFFDEIRRIHENLSVPRRFVETN